MKTIKLKKVKLEPEPRRGDLTTREMVSIIGGLIGSLCENAQPEKVRAAITWWATMDLAWSHFDGKISSEIERVMKARLASGECMTATGLADIIADNFDLSKKE